MPQFDTYLSCYTDDRRYDVIGNHHLSNGTVRVFCDEEIAHALHRYSRWAPEAHGGAGAIRGAGAAEPVSNITTGLAERVRFDALLREQPFRQQVIALI